MVQHDYIECILKCATGYVSISGWLN